LGLHFPLHSLLINCSGVNVLTLWPVMLILNYTHVEVFQWPSPSTLGYIALNGIVGTALSDYLWFMAVLVGR
jgi:drug/metabolite transporter (DMT)-like permease